MFYRKSYLFIFFFLFVSCDKSSLILLEKIESIPPQKIVTIKINNYCPEKNSKYVDLFVSHFSMKIEKNNLLRDFDRDGLPNGRDMDNVLNLRYDSFDTNGDGYGDLVIFLTGITYFDQRNLKRCFNINQDTDDDGLNDCEEDFLITDSKNFDSDGDGIPDYLELRNRLQPLNSNDANLDSDMDNLTNIIEVQLNTPLFEKNTPEISKLALKYEKVPSKTQSCSDIVISNIPIVSVSNGNLVQFGFVEEEFPNKFRKYIRKSIVVPRSIEINTILEFEYEEL